MSPDAGGQGIGSAILRFLESQAIGLNVPMLGLDSSITAERFYTKNGYSTVARGDRAIC